jgi:hypothetical protein
VLNAGNALGFLIYPALRDGEAFQIRYLPDNRYLFSFIVRNDAHKAVRVFTLRYTPSGGGGAGQWTEELIYQDPAIAMADSEIFGLRDALFDAPNLGSAIPGSVGLRGATNFVTPEGWDTVYTAILNNPVPPTIPVLTVRVETDWFAFDTEFRYVLQAGDSLWAGSGDPIGQVFFLPRGSATLRVGSDEDMQSFEQRFESFQANKRSDKVETPTGFRYSPAYHKKMVRIN